MINGLESFFVWRYGKSFRNIVTKDSVYGGVKFKANNFSYNQTSYVEFGITKVSAAESFAKLL